MFTMINRVDHFFFQAEDGIRDLYVTGVQTCALPISSVEKATLFIESEWPYCTTSRGRFDVESTVEAGYWPMLDFFNLIISRSEERRVGKECRSSWGPEFYKQYKI